MRCWILALLLVMPLGGCFYSLDGSLVDKKRDSGVDIALSDAKPDAPAGEALPDAPPTETVPDAVGEATDLLDLLAEGLVTEAAPEAGLDASATE